MSDRRAYFKLDVGYLTNPKVAAILDDHPTAVLLHIGSIAYSAQHLTDGVVPVGLLMRISAASDGDDQILFDSGLWLEHSPGQAQVHDYLMHQRSSVEAKGASDKAAAAARARWDAREDATEHAAEDAERIAKSNSTAMPRERERKKEKNVRDDVASLCSLLADRIEANGSKRPTINNRWLTDARLLLDKDGRPEAEVRKIIDWCQDSEFWRANIMSMAKVREKYDTLRLQAAKDQPKAAVTESNSFWTRRPFEAAANE